MEKMNEVWANIDGYEGLYLISNYGKIMNIKRHRFLSNSIDFYGYETVHLSNNCIHKRKKVHRLVASAFIKNPYNYPQVNHKDGNKVNNYVDNLEWCTAKYNVNYSRTTDKAIEVLKKTVVQIDMHGNVLGIYESYSQAGRETGVLRQSIGKVCAGHLKKAGGFIWRDVGTKEQLANVRGGQS